MVRKYIKTDKMHNKRIIAAAVSEVEGGKSVSK